MNPDVATPEDPDARPNFALPSHLSAAGREEFMHLVLTYARDLRDELDKEPSHEGVRGRAEVGRAAGRLRGRSDSAAVARTTEAQSMADPDGIAARQAVITALVVLGGYLIPYLGLSPMYLVAYLCLQIGLLALVVVRRR